MNYGNILAEIYQEIKLLQPDGAAISCVLYLANVNREKYRIKIRLLNKLISLLHFM